jgi:hypothetical protein
MLGVNHALRAKHMPHVSTPHLSFRQQPSTLQAQKAPPVVTLGVPSLICYVRLSGKAPVQDREEVEENKGKEMNGQERKIRT